MLFTSCGQRCVNHGVKVMCGYRLYAGSSGGIIIIDINYRYFDGYRDALQVIEVKASCGLLTELIVLT